MRVVAPVAVPKILRFFAAKAQVNLDLVYDPAGLERRATPVPESLTADRIPTAARLELHMLPEFLEMTSRPVPHLPERRSAAGPDDIS